LLKNPNKADYSELSTTKPLPVSVTWEGLYSVV